MAERQQHHEHALENKLVQANIEAQRTIFTSVFILAAIGMVGGIVLIALGRDLAGFAFIATVLGAIGGLYWVGQRGRERHNDKAAGEGQGDDTGSA